MRREPHPFSLVSAQGAGRKTAWPGARLQRPAGFTLYELLITLLIAGVLVTAGAGLWQVIQKNRQTVEVNHLLAILALARSEAIRRGQNTVLCPSANGATCDVQQGELTWWHRGMLLFVDANGNGRRDHDEPIVRVFTPTVDDITIKSRLRRQLTFRPTGLAPGSTITFTICDRRGTHPARYVIVSNTGRARVSSRPPSGNTNSVAVRCP